MRLRTALAQVEEPGDRPRRCRRSAPQYAQDYIARFGFDPKLHPPYLHAWRWAPARRRRCRWSAAYAVFANGGYRVAPYLIAQVVDARGNVLSEAKPIVAGETAERAIDPRNAFVMTSLLQRRDRVRHRRRARMSLGRSDLAGKTGTTNENVDAWFCGFNADAGRRRVDRLRPAEDARHQRNGRGRRAADLDERTCRRALKGVPEKPLATPDGVISVPHQRRLGVARSSRATSAAFLRRRIAPRRP